MATLKAAISIAPTVSTADGECSNVCREHLCGYDLNLTYPQRGGHFPTLRTVDPSDPLRDEFEAFKSSKREFFRKTLSSFAFAAPANTKRAEEGALARGGVLSMRANGTLDPWYGCFIYDEMIDFAVNFSAPWSESSFSLQCGCQLAS